MIDCKELRIGNIISQATTDLEGGVYHPYVVVTGNLIKEIELHPYLGYNPIPLDAELLVKCGFQKTHFGNFYRIDNGKFSPWLEWENDYFEVVVGDPEYSIGEVKYLHQLQNLYFALTGEELNYQP